jgi:hypothetical protein
MNESTPWYKDPKQRIRLKVGEIVKTGDVWIATGGEVNYASSSYVGYPYPSETVPFYRKKDNTLVQARISECEREILVLEQKISKLKAMLIKE